MMIVRKCAPWALIMMSAANMLTAETGTATSSPGSLTSRTPGSPLLKSPADRGSGVMVPVFAEWFALVHAGSYTLQVSDLADFSNLIVNESGLTSTGYSVAGLAIGTVHYWRVRAANRAGDGLFTPPWSFTTDASLSVELLAFSAEPVSGGMMVKWCTMSETDNAGFTLERADIHVPRQWLMIASYQTHEALQGQGSTSRRTDYAFFDSTVQPGQTCSYRLSDVNRDGETHVYDVITIERPDAPEATTLAPPYPNPFNPQTKVHYELSAAGAVEIAVYDVLGRKVRTLLNQHQAAGAYDLFWHGRNDAGILSATGTYLIVLKTGAGVHTQKVMLVQ